VAGTVSFSVKSTAKRQVIDITDQVNDKLDGNGVANVFVAHTTAAITTADLDPGGTDEDYLQALAAMTPDKQWRHPHDPEHFPDHLWASLIGPGLNVPFSDGGLRLGTWQRVVLIELDGPRERKVEITF
jgi:secondary thiamine-phosphate synthase enzyme